MIRNEYRERWAQWLPQALQALAKYPPDYASVMPHMPLPAPTPMPFARVSGPLRIAIVSSSGAYDTRSHAPFAASAIVGDPTHRVLDAGIPAQHLEFAHEHFDHAPAKQDLECIIPRETIRSVGAQLTPHLISWTGFLLDWPTFIEATVPQIVKQVKDDGANAAVLVPI
jgi:D-proline reductase (dithiol) PrdB